MVALMKLNDAPFCQIEDGTKKIELRLFDEKRRRIDLHDYIIFSNITDERRKLAVVVKSLHRYTTFMELFKDIPPSLCGFGEYINAEEAAGMMGAYYTQDEISTFGVLGIGIELTSLSFAKHLAEDQKTLQMERLFPDGVK